MRYAINHYRQKPTRWQNPDYEEYRNPEIIRVHQSIPEYQPTPLVGLTALADKLGLGGIVVKDESQRFGLKAFKALGASYAVYRFLKQHESTQNIGLIRPEDFYRAPDFLPKGQITLCTATDGNHGRAVAWTARKLRQRAVIYMPADSVEARVNNIKSENAEVVLVEGSYDDAVLHCRRDAQQNGWHIISDTAWEGYGEIPNWIVAGYTTMFKEIDAVLNDNRTISHVILPAGVGSFAASAVWYYNTVHTDRAIKLIIVEPERAACLLWSLIENEGQPGQMPDLPQSIMAGLCCGTPSPGAWPLIREGADIFMTVEDSDACAAMRLYAKPIGSDQRIISGESGAAALAALMRICDSELMEKLGIDNRSIILLFNTEGDTDPLNYQKIINSGD